MLDTTDVLVHRHPVVGILFSKRHLFPISAGRGVAQEIPARFHEGIEGIGLALGRSAAFRAGGLLPGRMELQRIALTRNLHIFRERDGEVLFFLRYDATLLAVHQRYRRPPVALARNEPVFEAVVDSAFAKTFFFEVSDDFSLRFLALQATELSAIEEYAWLGVGLGGIELALFGFDHILDGQIIFFSKLEIALIVCRHCHHRTATVFSQHEVGHPDGDFGTRERVDGIEPQKEPLFFGLLARAGVLVLHGTYFGRRFFVQEIFF